MDRQCRITLNVPLFWLFLKENLSPRPFENRPIWVTLVLPNTSMLMLLQEHLEHVSSRYLNAQISLNNYYSGMIRLLDIVLE